MGCSASSEVACSKSTVDIDALVSAITKGHIVPITYMLKRNPDLLTKASLFPDYQSIWHLACRHGHLGVLEAAMGLMWVLLPDQDGKLLPEGAMPPERIHPVMPTLINTFDKDGNTPLSLACMEHHPVVVSFLMWQGADPWMRTGSSLGLTPLHMAANVNASDSLDMLLSHPSSRLSRPATPTSTKMVKLADAPSKWGFTALHCAAANHNLDSLVVLLKHGASINSNTWDNSGEPRDWMNCAKGSTPLARGCERELKVHDITDPRLVEDKDGNRPYQVLARSKADKETLAELSRMLTPDTSMSNAMAPYQETVLQMPAVTVTEFPRPVTRQTGRARTSDSDKCSTARDSDTPGSNTERSSGTPGLFDRDTDSPGTHPVPASFIAPNGASERARLSRQHSNKGGGSLGLTSSLSGRDGNQRNASQLGGVRFGGRPEEPSSGESAGGVRPANARFLRKTASDVGMRTSTPAARGTLGASGRYSQTTFARGNSHLGVGTASEWGGVVEEGQEGIAESGDSYGPEVDAENTYPSGNGASGSSNLPSPSSNGLSGRGTPAARTRGAGSNHPSMTHSTPAPLRAFFGTPATTPGGGPNPAAGSSFKSLYVSDEMLTGGSGGWRTGSPKNAFASNGRMASSSFGQRGKPPTGYGVSVRGGSDEGSSESREPTPIGSSPKGGSPRMSGTLPPLVNPIPRGAGSKGSPGGTLKSTSSFKLIIQEAERQAQEAKYLALEHKEALEAAEAVEVGLNSSLHICPSAAAPQNCVWTLIRGGESPAEQTRPWSAPFHPALPDTLRSTIFIVGHPPSDHRPPTSASLPLTQAANNPPSPLPQQLPSPGRLSNTTGPGNKGIAAHSSFKLLIREAERQAQEAKYATIDETAAVQAVQLKPNAWGGAMDLPPLNMSRAAASPVRGSTNGVGGMRSSPGSIHPDRFAGGTSDYSPHPAALNNNNHPASGDRSPLRAFMNGVERPPPPSSRVPVYALVVDGQTEDRGEAVTAFTVDASDNSGLLEPCFQRHSSNPGTPTEQRRMQSRIRGPPSNDLPFMYDATPQKLRSSQAQALMRRDRDQTNEQQQQQPTRMGRGG
ncbi:MAG: hypothetical protein WDW36_000592 [Sanguina aurantia]